MPRGTSVTCHRDWLIGGSGAWPRLSRAPADLCWLSVPVHVDHNLYGEMLLRVDWICALAVFLCVCVCVCVHSVCVCVRGGVCVCGGGWVCGGVGGWVWWGGYCGLLTPPPRCPGDTTLGHSLSEPPEVSPDLTALALPSPPPPLPPPPLCHQKKKRKGGCPSPSLTPLLAVWCQAAQTSYCATEHELQTHIPFLKHASDLCPQGGWGWGRGGGSESGPVSCP